MLSGMKVALLGALVLLMASPSYAVDAKVFDCKVMEEYKGKEVEVHVKFALSFGEKHVNYEYIDAESAENFSPVVWEPHSLAADREIWPSVATLNDNFSVGYRSVMKQVVDKKTKKKKWVVDRKKEPNIELSGDGDGVVLVDLVLYTDSNYRKGYFKTRPSGEKSTYQEITCSWKDKKLPDFED